jgi:O-antigen ligase
VEGEEKMKITDKLYTGITLLLICSLLFSIKVNSLCIIALVLVWLAEGKFRQKFRQLAGQPFFITQALLFLMYLVSVALSEDKSTAKFFIEKNLSLLVLPAVLLSRQSFRKEQVAFLLKVFVAGSFVIMNIALLLSVKQYFTNGDPGVFFYHKLAGNGGMSAIIASFICSMSLVFLFWLPWGNNKLKWILCSFFCGWILLLASKLFLGVLILLLLINVFFLFPLKGRITLLFGILCLMVVISVTNNPVRERFMDIRKFRFTYLTAKSYDPSYYFDGLSMRLVFLRFAVQIMEEDGNYWLGVGTGDAEQLLKKKVAAYNMYTGDGIKDKQGYLQYGFHNEYVQKLVQLGIIGFSLFISGFVYCIYTAIRYRSKLLFNLVIIFGLSFMTDTLLELQVGLVSYLVFICLALNVIKEEREVLQERQGITA